MKRRVVLFLFACVFSWLQPAQAQRREFLTDGEIYQIREAQEPNERLKLYVRFARERLNAAEKALAGSEASRGEMIHDNLREYDQIIDAIDRNVEQAVQRRDLARKGLELALKEEPEFLKLLESFRARNPKDLEEYRFILNQAMDTTESSIASLREALAKQPKGRKEEKEEKRKLEQERGQEPRRPEQRGPERKGQKQKSPQQQSGQPQGTTGR